MTGVRACCGAAARGVVAQTIKFYDVSIFDMTVMVPVTYEPGCCEWIFRRGAAVPVVRCGCTVAPPLRFVCTDR